MQFKKSDMRGVVKRLALNPKEVRTEGRASISCYDFNAEADPLYNMRALRDEPMLMMYSGRYARLLIDKKLVMSDTNMERLTNEPFIEAAHGRVLIGGLGIGLVLENLIEKLESGEVTEIVVVEYYKDVITLVSPYFKDDRIKIIHGDINKYKPEGKFDTIYFDIWGGISTDNLKEMAELKTMFMPFLNKKGWIDSWLRKYLVRKAREESQEYSGGLDNYQSILKHLSSNKLMP